MVEASDPRIGTLLEGRYRLDTRLAAGGMGVVYKGELVAIGKPVAIKFLHDALAAVPDLVKRFQREATAMSRLAHPHLVSVVDSGLAGGVPFLVMDFVSGRSLAEVLADGPMAATRAATITKQILAGVKHAHTSGVVHRDLKPDNILVLADVEDDFVKILDFGLAKVVQGGSGDASQLTNTGFALGTPGYMSPEQARGTESDERSDLYSVGVILYHMVTGRKPFIADSPLAVLRMHMDDAPTPPTQLLPRCCSPELERLILRAMAKEPNARFQSAGAFAQALAATPEARDAGFTDEPSVRRRPWWTMVGARFLVRAALAAVLVAAVAVTWNQLSKRAQLRVKRRLDDAVKMAQGAFEAAKGADEQPILKKGEPAPKKEEAKKGEPPPRKEEAKKEEPPAPPTPPTPPKKEEAKKEEPVPLPGPLVPPPVAKPEEPPRKEEPVVAAKSEPPPPAPPVPPTAPEIDDDDDDIVEEPVAPRDTPGAKLEEAVQEAPPSAPVAQSPSGPAKAKGPTTADAQRLLATNRVDEAIKMLYLVRRQQPRSATVALLLGHAYFRKLWRTDGLREYDTAIKLSPLVRHNLMLVRNTVAALEDPTYRLARAVIKARLGVAALSEVRRAARTAKSPRVRARAARLAQQLAHRRR